MHLDELRRALDEQVRKDEDRKTEGPLMVFVVTSLVLSLLVFAWAFS